MDSILKLSTKELREISKNNNVIFNKDKDSVSFANDCGTVSNERGKGISYHAYLLVKGEFGDEDEHGVHEFANAYCDIYMAVAQRAFPLLQNLKDRYENHSLDAGLHLDRTKGFFDPDRYIITWLSIDDKTHLAGKNPERSDAEELIHRLGIFTRENTTIYKEALESYRNNPFLTFLKNKEFVPQLPTDIKSKFKTLTEKCLQ